MWRYIDDNIGYYVGLEFECGGYINELSTFSIHNKPDNQYYSEYIST